jgi:hypothetical protein
MMKSIMVGGALVCLATVAVTGRAHAATCATTGTFASLEAAGSCTIGDKTFSDFSYTPAEIGGATEVPATSFNYATVNNVSNQWGFDFTFPLAAGSNQTNDIALGYTVAVTSGAASINSATDGPITGSITGTGAAAVGETYCLGASTIVGCPGGDLGVLGASLPNTPEDSVTAPGGNCLLGTGCPFFNVSEIALMKDITTSGGTDGTAALSVLINTVDQDTPVPVSEPASLAILAVGLISMGTSAGSGRRVARLLRRAPRPAFFYPQERACNYR